MRKVVLIAALACAAAAPAMAFEVDYPALFAKHADQVRDAGEGQRALDLPGPVTVIERALANGATRYTALDLSGYGPAGCGFDTVVNALAFAKACEGSLTEAELATLRVMAEKAADFVSMNGPAGGTASEVLDEALADAHPLRCPEEDEANADYAEQIKSLVSEEGVAAFAAMLAEPRLPVCLTQEVPPAR